MAAGGSGGAASGRRKVFVWKNFDHDSESSLVVKSKRDFINKSSSCYNGPSIYSLSPLDLFDFIRLEALYVQAVEEGIIVHAPRMPVYWVASALMARLDPDSPLKSFSSLVTGQYWSLIPDRYVSWAERLLAFHRGRNSALFDSASFDIKSAANDDDSAVLR
jgi:hypothetical protein